MKIWLAFERRSIMWRKVVFLATILPFSSQMDFSSIQFFNAVGQNRKATLFGCGKKGKIDAYPQCPGRGKQKRFLDFVATSKLLSEKGLESNWISTWRGLDGTIFHKSRHIFLVNLNCPETIRFLKHVKVLYGSGFVQIFSTCFRRNNWNCLHPHSDG